MHVSAACCKSVLQQIIQPEKKRVIEETQILPEEQQRTKNSNAGTQGRY